MNYIEIIDSGSNSKVINLQTIADFKVSGSSIYFTFSVGYANTIALTSADEALEIYEKLKSILSALNINSLPTQ